LSAELLTLHSLATDRGPLEGALAVYQLAVEEQGRNGGAIHGRMEQNKFGHALQVVAQQESERDAAVAYYRRGNAYGKKGDLDRAIADYDKAIELDPKYVMAYNNRGIAYGKKGDFDSAIADLNKAIELDPKYVKACPSSEFLRRGAV
jgi:tetratricopeptide (TPR) repeat protein